MSGEFYSMCEDHMRRTSNYLSRDSQKKLLRIVQVLRDSLHLIGDFGDGEYETIDSIIAEALLYDGERFIPKKLRGPEYLNGRNRKTIEPVRTQTFNRSFGKRGGQRGRDNEQADS